MNQSVLGYKLKFQFYALRFVLTTYEMWKTKVKKSWLWFCSCIATISEAPEQLHKQQQKKNLVLNLVKIQHYDEEAYLPRWKTL